MARTSSLPVLAPSKQCACGHPVSAHDDIAGRYCRATAAQGHARGCICRELLPPIAVAVP
jgi:hypothetical protein